MIDVNVSTTLADFAAGHRWTDVPEPTRHATRRMLLNAVALAIGAAKHSTVRIAADVFDEIGSPPQATLFGRHERLGLTAAPLINGMAIHVEDYDDTHLRTVLHPGAPIVPAVLAVAEHANTGGEEVLAALTVGAEVALRVANGMCPGHFDLGWHVTGTAGHLGAAAGASRALGLTTEQTRDAIALGATQAAGFTEANGTMTKSLHPGKAAADGVEAALLAAEGFTGPSESIEGRRGFARVAAPSPDFNEMLTGLTTHWEIDDNAIKPYACGIVSHAVIDAAVEVRKKVEPDSIEAIEVHVPEVVLQVMGITDPADGLQSKFSVHHCVAIGLLDGGGGPPQFSNTRARANDVLEMRRKVRAVIDHTLPKGAAKLSVRTTEGGELEEVVYHATASTERPMTDDQLLTKVGGLVLPTLGDGGAEQLWIQCQNLDTAADVNGLLTATSPTT